jgi:hypothetical protein
MVIVTFNSDEHENGCDKYPILFYKYKTNVVLDFEPNVDMKMVSFVSE